MSIFNVELKKVVDDTYDIEIGYNLSDTLVSDLENGLVQPQHLQSYMNFLVITAMYLRAFYRFFTFPLISIAKQWGVHLSCF